MTIKPKLLCKSTNRISYYVIKLTSACNSNVLLRALDSVIFSNLDSPWVVAYFVIITLFVYYSCRASTKRRRYKKSAFFVFNNESRQHTHVLLATGVQQFLQATTNKRIPESQHSQAIVQPVL